MAALFVASPSAVATAACCARRAPSTTRPCVRLPGGAVRSMKASGEFARSGRTVLALKQASGLRRQALEVRNSGSDAVPVTDVEAEVEDADGYYLELVNEIVAAGTWDAVQAKVAELTKDGKMNERVLDAAIMLLQECRSRSLPDNVIATMEAVCELLTRAVEESQMTPTMKLMRQLAELNPKVPNEVNEIEQMMEQAFARDVAIDDFTEDVQFFLKAMEEEESTLPTADAAAAKEQQAQFEVMRKDAKERMNALLKIATTSPRVAKAVEAGGAAPEAPSGGEK